MADTMPFSGDAAHSYSISTSTVKEANVTTYENYQLHCDYISTNYSIVAAILCIACFIFGVLYTFFGYRFLKAVMFLTGFIFGSVILYTVCFEKQLLPPEGNIGVAVGAGILSGLVAMLVQYVGLFLTGFHFGVAVGVFGLIVVEQFVHPTVVWIPVSVLLGVGLVFGILSLKFQKALTILGTSVLGGALMVTCLDYFIELAAMMQYVWDRFKGNISHSVCWYSWIVLGCWPFCFIVGSLVQWRVTSMGIDHRDVLHNKKGVDLQRLRMRQRRDAQHTRYRHLYQVRRVNGDVISQGYIQSVQHKLSPATQSLTAMSTDPSATELESPTTTLTHVP